MPSLLIVQYTKILNAYGGPNSNKAKEFLAEYKEDELFVERAEKLNKMWKAKENNT